MSMPKPGSLTIAALSALLFGATALAQGTEDQAKRDFEAGVAAEKRGEQKEACRLYRAALEKLRAAGPLGGVAYCDAADGRFLEATTKLEEALATLPADHPKRAAYEADLATWKAKAKLARLKITVKAGATVSELKLDGKLVTPRSEPYELEPGQHVVRVDGQDEKLDLEAGVTRLIEIGTPPGPLDTSEKTGPGDTGLADGAAGSPWLPLAVVAFSVGGAAIVATAVTGALVIDQDSTAEALCTPTRKAGCDQAIEDGKALLAPNLAMWIVSGVAVAAGVTFLIVDATSQAPSKPPSSSVSLRLMPAAVELSGSF